MTGVIWFVQIVHYPLFSLIPSDARKNYCSHHSRLTSWVVILPMVIELGTGILLFLRFPEKIEWQLGLLLLAGIWLSTFLIQVPLHKHLAEQGDLESAQKLARSNWLRTFLWTGRACLLSYFLFDFIAPSGT